MCYDLFCYIPIIRNPLPPPSPQYWPMGKDKKGYKKLLLSILLYNQRSSTINFYHIKPIRLFSGTAGISESCHFLEAKLFSKTIKGLNNFVVCTVTVDIAHLFAFIHCWFIHSPPVKRSPVSQRNFS